jgi:hypothetical protein
VVYSHSLGWLWYADLYGAGQPIDRVKRSGLLDGNGLIDRNLHYYPRSYSGFFDRPFRGDVRNSKWHHNRHCPFGLQRNQLLYFLHGRSGKQHASECSGGYLYRFRLGGKHNSFGPLTFFVRHQHRRRSGHTERMWPFHPTVTWNLHSNLDSE